MYNTGDCVLLDENTIAKISRVVGNFIYYSIWNGTEYENTIRRLDVSNWKPIKRSCPIPSFPQISTPIQPPTASVIPTVPQAKIPSVTQTPSLPIQTNYGGYSTGMCVKDKYGNISKITRIEGGVAITSSWDNSIQNFSGNDDGAFYLLSYTEELPQIVNCLNPGKLLTIEIGDYKIKKIISVP